MKHVVAWLVAWLALFWLWLLLAGDWNRIELVAAASAATVAATIGEVARTRADVRAHVPWRLIAAAKSVPVIVFVDFGIVMWALGASLVRREVVRGSFRSHAFQAGRDAAESAGVRAWTEVVATYSPNAYVVEIERDRVTLHDLVPWRESEKPA